MGCYLEDAIVIIFHCVDGSGSKWGIVLVVYRGSLFSLIGCCEIKRKHLVDADAGVVEVLNCTRACYVAKGEGRKGLEFFVESLRILKWHAAGDGDENVIDI